MNKVFGILLVGFFVSALVGTDGAWAGNWDNSAKYTIKNIDKFRMSKDKKLDCNIKDYYSVKYSGAVNKNENIDTDWYLFDAWGIKHKRGIEKKYEHGKSLGGCINKDGSGFYYTAVQSRSQNGKKQSWVNITSLIGERAWVGSIGNIYGKQNKDFPTSIGEIKKFKLVYDYNFKSKGLYNNNITFWLRRPNGSKPFIEIMLKFDATARKHHKYKLKNIKTDNYDFNVYSSQGKEFQRKNEGLDYFFSIDAFEKNTKINKDGNYYIDINLKQVFDYLLERKLVKNTDIIPGIEVTTEIWDGAGEMKIKKLKYEIEKSQKEVSGKRNYSDSQICAIAKTSNGLWNNQYEDEGSGLGRLNAGA